MRKSISLSKMLAVLAIGTLLVSCSAEDGMDGPMGPQGEQGPQGPEGPQGSPGPASNYVQITSLNNGEVTATSAATPIGPVLVIDKEYPDSKIEVIMNSRCGSGTFSGAFGVVFSVRVNGDPGNLNSQAAITSTNTVDFLSILDVFEGLETGKQNVQVYVRTNAGTSTDVILDPGGWGGMLIAKEAY